MVADPYTVISLVSYINLLHQGKLDKSLFLFFEDELKSCSAQEVNLAIENLIIRYKDVESIEGTVTRFIRAVSSGLEKQKKTGYLDNSIFTVLEEENRFIRSLLAGLKDYYMKKLPALKSGDGDEKKHFAGEIRNLEIIKSHYLKLQYGIFSALETVNAPLKCIKLMWHMQDSVWIALNNCLDLLKSETWDYREFNNSYGRMYFLLASLLYREEQILFPAASLIIPEDIQFYLLKEVESYGKLG